MDKKNINLEAVSGIKVKDECSRIDVPAQARLMFRKQAIEYEKGAFQQQFRWTKDPARCRAKRLGQLASASRQDEEIKLVAAFASGAGATNAAPQRWPAVASLLRARKEAVEEMKRAETAQCLGQRSPCPL